MSDMVQKRSAYICCSKMDQEASLRKTLNTILIASKRTVREMIDIARVNKPVHRKEIDFPIDDWTIIEKRAAELGITSTRYIRDMALKGEIVAYKFDDLIPFFDNLDEIKKRLDQIAVVARKTKKVNIDAITKIQSEVEQMRHNIVSFLVALKDNGRTAKS